SGRVRPVRQPEKGGRARKRPFALVGFGEHLSGDRGKGRMKDVAAFLAGVLPFQRIELLRIHYRSRVGFPARERRVPVRRWLGLSSGAICSSTARSRRRGASMRCVHEPNAFVGPRQHRSSTSRNSGASVLSVARSLKRRARSRRSPSTSGGKRSISP